MANLILILIVQVLFFAILIILILDPFAPLYVLIHL